MRPDECIEEPSRAVERAAVGSKKVKASLVRSALFVESAETVVLKNF
jgi:hypothetical protein